MEITKQQQNVLGLSAKIDPRSIGFKLPGIQTWILLVTFLILCVFIPRTALTIARFLAIYFLLRFIAIGVFYVVTIHKTRRTQARLRATGPLDGLTAEQVARYPKIHHVVIIPNYKEPIEVLSRTLQALVDQSISGEQLTVVLAMEKGEAGAAAKGQALEERFSPSFAHFFVTVHPEGMAGEIQGKAANQNWGARFARHELVDRLGMRLEDLTITSCDADSVLDKDYFRELTREFLTTSQPENAIWQTPIFFDHNIWLVPASVRLMTFITNAVQVSELSMEPRLIFPLSTYSLSFKLVVDVGYWDPIVIAEDWHMFLRCFFAKDGDMRVHPMFLPTKADPFLGENVWKTWEIVYRTRIRHAWGAGDMVYILQQWNRNPRTPFFKKLSRLLKIWHDHMAFILASVVVGIGTLLSLSLDQNQIITYVAAPVPYLMEFVNGLGMVSMLTMWFGERMRCSNRNFTWKLTTVIPEIVSWVFLAFITFVLTGLPVLHAHTKMLLGDNLVFERTPKGILPKERV
jgi:cellulose synthase/poly-beta-1,6-N-acetylglucosamine synthase-like glycosyltransferase